MIVGFPGETEEDFAETLSLATEVGFDAVFAFKFSPRPNTPAISLSDSLPEDEKSRRLQMLLDAQREIQRSNYASQIGQVVEAAVEGFNTQRGQVIGRTSQNKTLNFTTSSPISPAPGSYVPVRITHSHPNSLVGEAVSSGAGMRS
jgi:tRNA-2-methylthio-N6-dimethylallyladenosine synthase